MRVELTTLMHKEALETLREGKSLMVFIVFCALFFPMFSLFGDTEISAALIEDSLTNQRGKIGVRGDMSIVREVLKNKPELQIRDIGDAEPVQTIEDEVFDIVVLMPEKDGDIEVLYNSHHEGTIAWAVEIVGGISISQKQLLHNKLKSRGIEKGLIETPQIILKNISAVERHGSAPLSDTLPGVIVFFISTVAIGGAIGGITMERENKRMIMLLLLPIKRTSIMYSLLIVISLVSLLPIISGLFSLSWAFSLDEIRDRLQAHNLIVSVPPEAVLMILLYSLPLSCGVTALSLYFACFYRVAQTARGYSLVFMLGINGVIRYLASLAPTNPIIQYLPVVNSLNVMQQALNAVFDPAQIIIATVSTIGFSVWLMNVSANLLNDETLLLGIEKRPKWWQINKRLSWSR
ncbi:MAG: ABC transporter permease [Leptolyngbya sp.]|nr:ABC transporter permease [Candidatus Melainabacteria bacterium]